MRLQGKRAIVTGGANGIGRATVEVFLREGASVTIADRDTEAGAALAGRNEQPLFIETDVSSDASVAELVARSVDHFGGLDIAVHCAGVSIVGTIADTEPERWQRVLDVNLGSLYRICHGSVPHMLAGGGAVVTIASVQGMFGWANWAGYAASKSGMFGLIRQMAIEYAEHNIRFNAISPGAIATQLGANSAKLEPGFTLRPDATQSDDDASPDPPDTRPRLLAAGKPEDIAHAALFLASDEAAYISGQNLVVDGVLTCGVG